MCISVYVTIKCTACLSMSGIMEMCMLELAQTLERSKCLILSIFPYCRSGGAMVFERA